VEEWGKGGVGSGGEGRGWEGGVRGGVGKAGGGGGARDRRWNAKGSRFGGQKHKQESRGLKDKRVSAEGQEGGAKGCIYIFIFLCIRSRFGFKASSPACQWPGLHGCVFRSCSK
jgi:hypothetical protein